MNKGERLCVFLHRSQLRNKALVEAFKRNYPDIRIVEIQELPLND